MPIAYATPSARCFAVADYASLYRFDALFFADTPSRFFLRLIFHMFFTYAAYFADDIFSCRRRYYYAATASLHFATPLAHAA